MAPLLLLAQSAPCNIREKDIDFKLHLKLELKVGSAFRRVHTVQLLLLM